MEFIHDRRFSDARISGNQDQLRHFLSDNAVKSGKQQFNFFFPSIKPFGDRDPLRQITRARRKRINPSVRFPARKTALKIRFQTHGRLITALRRLCEEL